MTFPEKSWRGTKVAVTGMVSESGRSWGLFRFAAALLLVGLGLIVGANVAGATSKRNGSHSGSAVLAATFYGENQENTPNFSISGSETPWVVKWTRTCPAGAGPLTQALTIYATGPGHYDQIVNDTSGATSGETAPESFAGHKMSLSVSSGCNWTTQVVRATVSHHEANGTVFQTYYGVGEQNTVSFNVTRSQSPWVLTWTRNCPPGTGPLGQALSVNVTGRGLYDQIVNDASGSPSGAMPPLSATGKLSLSVSTGCAWSMTIVSARDYHGHTAPSPVAGAPPSPTTTTPTTAAAAPPPPPPPPTTTPGRNDAASAPPGIAGPVPNVVGENLSPAEATLLGDNLGYTTESSGVFGVIVASDWTVCSQSPSPGSVAASVNLVVARSC
jgi:hypothetical protein